MLTRLQRMTLLRAITDNLCPRIKITNAEFCTMFANCAKIDATSQAAINYTDVKESAWYYDTVSKLSGHGYLTNSSTFSPNKAITREEAVQIIGKWYANKYNKDITEFKSHKSPVCRCRKRERRDPSISEFIVRRKYYQRVSRW